MSEVKMPEKKWSELSVSTRRLIVVGSILELVLTVLALRDLAKRPPGDVRGPKWIWRLLAFVQPVGPIAYLTLGRRP